MLYLHQPAQGHASAWTQAHGRRRKDAGPCLDASRKRKSNRRAEGPDLHKKEEEGWFKKKQRLKRQR